VAANITKRSQKETKLLDEKQKWGAWLAQWVEHVTLDLGVVSSSPTLGVEIT